MTPANGSKDGDANDGDAKDGDAKPSPGRSWRKIAGKVLRTFGTVGVLVIVFTRVPLSDLAERFSRLSVGDIGALVVIAVLQMSVGATRWWRLLIRLRERPSFGAIYGDLLVGALFNTFLPTNVGGDVIRAIRASRRLQHGHHAWSSSLFERLVGLLTLAVVGASAATFAVGEALPAQARIVVIVITLVLALLFFFASAPLRFLVRLLEKRLPSTFVADIRGIASDLEGPLATAPARLETFAWSLTGFIIGIGFMSFAASALGAPGHTMAILVGIPIISILSLAPISLGGHGLREGLFVVILGMLGLPKDVALGLALFALGSYVMFALAGAAVAFIEPVTKRKADAA